MSADMMWAMALGILAGLGALILWDRKQWKRAVREAAQEQEKSE